jgi:hypothetical protein
MADNMNDDLVQILVPRHLVIEIYRLIAKNGGSLPMAAIKTETSDGLPGAWTAPLLRLMYKESPTAMRAFLDALVARPGEDVPATEMIDVLSRSCGRNANGKILGGTLSAFERRVWNRYKQDGWPFEWWVDDKKQLHYRMDHRVARLLKGE